MKTIKLLSKFAEVIHQDQSSEVERPTVRLGFVISAPLRKSQQVTYILSLTSNYYNKNILFLININPQWMVTT